MFTYEQLVSKLQNSRVLKTPHIIEAFEKVDRKGFVPPKCLDIAYIDKPIPIGFGQTNSQPTTVAIMFELLQPQAGDHILDVGSGSGWTTALLAEIVGEEGSVIGVEKIPELVKFGQENLKESNAKIVQAGDTLGLPEKAPFDKILISAAATSLPKELLHQLKIGGVLVIPVNNSIFEVERIGEEEFREEEFYGFSFVPLK
ncbi:protein-L-isoaspartate O-methyltransferase [Patescibacteria group bacterium]